jgi:p-hydroxybenzoate 3-monooxygenase
MRTQVGIVGAGPAGLMLSQLLHLDDIESIVVEAHTRDYVEHRIRAGLMEHFSVELLRQAGVGARMDREGLVHRGIVLRFGGRSHRIPLSELTGGKSVMIYGQHEVVKDLIAGRLATGGQILFEAEAIGVDDFDSDRPRIRLRHGGREQQIECDIIAGCDGFHGICRAALPPGHLNVFDRIYPFGWLGILADVAPSNDELVYANHERGFALLTMRSRKISRLYLQCAPDEDADAWSDEQIWAELETRLFDDSGFVLHQGRILQKGVTAMRSYVVEPLRCGRLFLLGDAAHIVPPTGAKGMNLAFADVVVLSRALADWYRRRNSDALENYSATALRRVWKAERFSWWMTTLMHRFEHYSPFERRMQAAELDYITTSSAAMTALAENYVGLPLA